MLPRSTIAAWKDRITGPDLCVALGEAFEALLVEREEFISALREVEWGAGVIPTEDDGFEEAIDSPICPCCHMAEAHTPQCRLDAALREKDR